MSTCLLQTTTPTPGPGFGRNTMNVLRRMSLMRSSIRPRNANSSLEDVDSIIREGFRSLASSLGTTNSAEKEKLDEAGNPILGGELLVTIVDAQVGSICCSLRWLKPSSAHQVSIHQADIRTNASAYMK